MAAREATVLQDALVERPPWLTALLVDLDDKGMLNQLRGSMLAQLLGDLATYRDRWGISGGSC